MPPAALPVLPFCAWRRSLQRVPLQVELERSRKLAAEEERKQAEQVRELRNRLLLFLADSGVCRATSGGRI